MGNQYRFGREEGVQVDSVEQVEMSSILDADAKRSGFTSASELCDFIKKASSAPLYPKTVEFHYVKQTKAQPAQADLSPKSLEELAAKLAKMDRLSRHGPWTREMLEIIAKTLEPLPLNWRLCLAAKRGHSRWVYAS